MTLAEFAGATHVELTLSLGGKIVMPRATYLALDEAQLAGSVVRALSRREVLKRRHQARSSSSRRGCASGNARRGTSG